MAKLLSYLVCGTAFLVLGNVARPAAFGPGQSFLSAPVPAIDATNREQVLTRYHEFYLPAVPKPGWTGHLLPGEPGQISGEFLRATLQRINYYRAMAGVRSDVKLDPKLNVDCQQTALMMALAGHISHHPPTSWRGYTPTAALTAAHSNLCVSTDGDLGPNAVDRYMAESAEINRGVGHRRWLLYPPARTMGTGTVPAALGRHSGANALWAQPVPGETAVSQAVLSALPPSAWPPAGYVPTPLLFRRWSYSCADADFRTATVQVIKEGRDLHVVSAPPEYQTDAHGHGQGLGLNTLTWTLPGNVVHSHLDEHYEVQIRGVLIDGHPRSFRYQVISIDPGSD